MRSEEVLRRGCLEGRLPFPQELPLFLCLAFEPKAQTLLAPAPWRPSINVRVRSALLDVGARTSQTRPADTKKLNKFLGFISFVVCPIDWHTQCPRGDTV